MCESRLLAKARAFFNKEIAPVLNRVPKLAAPMEDYDFLLEFSRSTGADPDELFRDTLRVVPNGDPIQLFVYIPQCAYRCSFCPFPVSLDEHVEEDARRLLKEAITFRDRHGLRSLPVSVFCVGGGTPSLLSPGGIYDLVVGARAGFAFSPDTFITMEVAPDSLTVEKVQAARLAGVVRVSMGVQTFDQPILDTCDRGHNARQVQSAVSMLMAADFEDVNIDLIRGFPGQSIEGFVVDLKQAIATEVTSVHVYRMRLPSQHILLRQSPTITKAFEDVTLMQIISDWLLMEHGYRRHHTAHWTRKNLSPEAGNRNWQHDRSLFGFGWSAYSYSPMGECRNVRSLRRWRELVDGGRLTTDRTCRYTGDEAELRWVKIALKDLGLSTSQFEARFGRALEASCVWPRLARLVDAGVLTFESDWLGFTTAGYYLAEEAIQFCGEA